jgi:hypothetical protein
MEQQKRLAGNANTAWIIGCLFSPVETQPPNGHLSVSPLDGRHPWSAGEF